jgi:hypothetical protein
MSQEAKQVQAKFQLSSFYPDGLRQILAFFSEIQNFSGNLKVNIKNF